MAYDYESVGRPALLAGLSAPLKESIGFQLYRLEAFFLYLLYCKSSRYAPNDFM